MSKCSIFQSYNDVIDFEKWPTAVIALQKFLTNIDLLLFKRITAKVIRVIISMQRLLALFVFMFIYIAGPIFKARHNRRGGQAT